MFVFFLYFCSWYLLKKRTKELPELDGVDEEGILLPYAYFSCAE